MASTSESPPLTDEVDLIDLETGITPQPRITIADATPEEQEHLLDVCPPKLEQKLSLTRRSHDHLRNSEERDNVLVTLGHDQVVPIRKRIDVVSTDTIKRVRDITKNLEPVIQSVDSVDNFVGDRDDDASRQINDAFDFLAELDDNEEEQHRILDQPKSYPLEPTCYIQEKSNSFVFDNAAFEASPPGKVNEKRPGSMNFDFDGLKAARNSFKRLRSLTCSAVGLDSEQPWRKRSKNCPYRKSWSAGSRRSRCDLVGKRKRRNSERMDKGVKRDRLKKSGSSVGQSSNSSSASSSSSSSSSSASSSCSEVDWSWVEEAAAAAAGSASTAATATAATSGEEAVAARLTPTSRRVRSPRGGGSGESSVSAAAEVGCSSSVAMSVAAAAAKSSSEPIVVVDSLLVQCNDQCMVPNLRDNDTSRIVNSVESNGGGTLPWLRASMRRLRQLRILESSNNTTTQDPCSSLPDIALIAPEILAAQTNDTTGNLLRPSSAPAPVRSAPAPPNSPNAATVTTATRTNATTVSTTTNTTNNTPRRGGRRSRCQQRQSSEAASAARSPSSAESTSTYASSNGGASSSVSSSTMSSATVSPVHQPNGTSSPRRLCERQRDGDRDDERGEDEDEDENPLGKWPHALSPALACLGCTLGLFNISRFAILSIQFGANFIVQFLILSLVIGIPLLTLQVCLGQRLSAGAVDMWKISPLFQGVGIALLTAHAFIGIYSIVGVSWIFVYFRDSFITKLDRYRWAEPFLLYREDFKPTISSTSYSIGYGSVYGSNSGNGNGNNNNNNNNNNGTYKLHETVPDYFSGAVLQRHHLNEPDPGVVTLKFQVAFNLAVVWMIVFVSLSKGLRSYGKVVYVFTLVPIFGTLVLCTKLLGLTPPGSINQLFPATVWAEFFINGRSWVAAASEVFLTWGLLGAAAMQIAAHNKHKHLLQRDTSLVIVLTLVVLLLAAFLANTCVQILKYHGYVYTTSSFERMTTYGFMRPYNQPAPSGYASTPERFMTHASFVVGQRVTRPGLGVEQQSTESGYQALRLATELVPATLAVLGTEQVSPFWAVLFYFILILFGIAQQLAIWHCVITGIMAINTKMMKLWETTITFFSCACAYILGLPMATEMGIYVVYYLDYTVGGGWWIIVLYLVQVGAVFAVRGRPHTGEAVVAELFPPTGRCLKYWAAPLLSFTWNVVLPITLMVLSISIFKNAGYRELYTYRRTKSDYWSVWARQLGGSIQLIPILMIPVVAIIQTCRYLNSGPPDIFDRIQLLYRPSLDLDDPQNGQTHLNGANGTSGHHNGANGLVSSTTELPFEDPPPKYTPPPSYTTATGARIAKMLRQSFRRSVRRIANVLGEGGSAAVTRSRPPLQQQPPPPDYATVLVEMNQSVSSRDVAIHIAEVRPDVANTRRQQRADRYARPNTIDRSICRGISTIDTCRGHYTVDRNAGRRPQTASNGTSNLTAAEVANLLRSSIRRVPQRQRTEAQLQQQQSPQQQQQQQIAASVENLVEAAAPIGHETAPNKQQQPPLVEQPDKTKDEMDSSVSVI